MQKTYLTKSNTFSRFKKIKPAVNELAIGLDKGHLQKSYS